MMDDEHTPGPLPDDIEQRSLPSMWALDGLTMAEVAAELHPAAPDPPEVES
jgi:hypothetical protein